MHLIVAAKYVRDYQIEVEFDNKKKGIIDLKDIINNDKRPIFQELRDKNKFCQIAVKMDTVVWKNGLDLSPEFLYQLL